MTRIPADLPVSVVFASSLDAGESARAPRPTVVVTPAPYNSWNNFGHNFDVCAWVLRTALNPQALPASIMFEGGERTSTRLSAILQGGPGWMDAADAPVAFCSLLRSVDDYGAVVQALGFDLAVSALRAIGDAVVLRLEGGDHVRLALVASSPFHQGMLRREDAYTALRRGARHLRPDPAPKVEDAATSFAMVVRLPSARNTYAVPFDLAPDPLGRDRLAVLIGRNGTGKTQLLLSLIDAMRDPGLPPLSSRERRARFARARVGGFEFARPQASRLIVFSSTGSDLYPDSLPPWEGVDYAFFSMTSRRDMAFDALTSSLLDCLRDDRRNTFPVETDADGLEDEVGRLGLLERVLAPLRLWNSLLLPIAPGADATLTHSHESEEGAYYPIFRFRSLNEQRQLELARVVDPDRAPLIIGRNLEPRRLSSGETAMLRFAAQAVGAVETGSLLLLDEPETHLHPNFVSDFVELLDRVLAATRSVAIVATHSAYIVREVPSRRVRVLVQQEGDVQVATPRMQTYGASIDSISDYVFFDGDRLHLHEHVLAAWLRENESLTLEEIVARYGRELNAETLSLIARLRSGTTES